MRCHDLHENGCQAELQQGWRWCPDCGRPTGSVKWLDLSLEVPRGKVCERRVRVRNCGLAPVAVDISEEEDILEVVSRGAVPIQPGAEEAITIRVGPLHTNRKVRFRLRANNGHRDGDNRWVKTPWATVGEPEVLLRIGRPGEILTNATVLAFSKRDDERTLVVENVGDSPLNCSMRTPIGYDVRPHITSFCLSAREAKEFKVRLDHSANISETESKISIGSDGQEELVEVSLLRVRQLVPKADYRFVVGVDFGTSHTSVVIRDTLVKDNEGVDFIPPDRPRQPTLIYKRPGGAVYYGTAAEEQAEIDPQEEYGIRIDDLKTPLRQSPGDPDAEPYVARAQQKGFANPEEFAIDRLLAEYFRWIKSQVDKAISERTKGASAHTYYVFTLPILDGGTLYEMQKQRTLRAAKVAGFPTDDPRRFGIEYEPVAAVWYFLRRRSYSQKLRAEVEKKLTGLAEADGMYVCVVDSGGGTTDIVLGRAHAKSASNPQFEVLAQLGLGSEGEDFGGKDVTERLKELIVEKTGRAPWGEGTQLSRRSEEIKKELCNYYSRPGTGEPFTDPDISVPVWEKDNGGAVLGRDGANEKDSIARRELDQIVETLWEPVRRAAMEQIFQKVGVEPASVNLVLPIGGNLHVPRLRELVSEGLFQDRDLDRVMDVDEIEKRIPGMAEDDKMLAVAAGSVWTPDMVIENALPFSLTVVDPDKEDQRHCFGMLSAMSGEFEDFIPRGEEEPLELHVRLKSSDVEGLAGRVRLDTSRRDSDGRFRLRYRLSPGKLSIVDAVANENEEVLCVQF